MKNFSRKHKLAIHTKFNHNDFRLGLSEFNRSEEHYKRAEKECRSRHRHREFRKALKKGGIL